MQHGFRLFTKECSFHETGLELSLINKSDIKYSVDWGIQNNKYYLLTSCYSHQVSVNDQFNKMLNKHLVWIIWKIIYLIKCLIFMCTLLRSCNTGCWIASSCGAFNTLYPGTYSNYLNYTKKYFIPGFRWKHAFSTLPLWVILSGFIKANPDLFGCRSRQTSRWRTTKTHRAVTVAFSFTK